ncbi:hypothetical protein BJX99DRAFT_224932 [Aspergillus californicus]
MTTNTGKPTLWSQSQSGTGAGAGQSRTTRAGQPTTTHPQAAFETTMNEQGELVPDEGFTDGTKKPGHSGADDEADMFEAATGDFDDM